VEHFFLTLSLLCFCLLAVNACVACRTSWAQDALQRVRRALHEDIQAQVGRLLGYNRLQRYVGALTGRCTGMCTRQGK
jgi:hypothetical protein